MPTTTPPRRRSRLTRVLRTLAILSGAGALVLAGLFTRSCREKPVYAPVFLSAEDFVVDTGPRDPSPPEETNPAPEAVEDEPVVTEPDPPTAERQKDYRAQEARSVLDLQQWRDVHSTMVEDDSGPRYLATVVDLNPWVHEWFVVQLTPTDGEPRTYHIENHAPEAVRVALDPDYPLGLTLHHGDATEHCPLWTPDSIELDLARVSGQTYAPLCRGFLSLRSPTRGKRSTLEWTTDFLRDKVWGGEQITALVRDTLFQDSELATSAVVGGDPDQQAAMVRKGWPMPPAVGPDHVSAHVEPRHLGLPLVGMEGKTVAIGRWYPVADSTGVFVSTLQPRFVDPALVADWGEAVHALDSVERSALLYMTAFSLDEHEVSFDIGTDHPRLDWSSRAPSASRDRSQPGPDGFATLSPLVRTGQVNPAHISRLVATFTGGFKRSHSAFKSGALSQVNGASHYGWVEHGVVESRPWPGLATFVVWADGTQDVRVWAEEDDAMLWKVQHLRQNGVPLLVPGEQGAVPGSLVTQWSVGNWSGSAEGKLRSVRASLCIQDSAQGRFLLYGYFSSATPSAMATVLAAYGCQTAMLMDMNALEHTYLSLHHFHDSVYGVHHLITGMEVLDRLGRGGVYLPRFVGLADNRDFFTVLRKP